MATLRKKAWKMFSLYIRLRDSSEIGVCECCTCGKLMDFDSDCHAGHFISGRSNAVLFDEKIVHAQCAHCNLWLSGSQGMYLLFMKKKYGYSDEELEAMLLEERKTVLYKNYDYINMIVAYYKSIQNHLKQFSSKEMEDRVNDKIKSIGVMTLIKECLAKEDMESSD